MRLCKLPDCNKLVTNWRHQCCSRSHTGKYAALVKHGVLIHTKIEPPKCIPKSEIHGPSKELFQKFLYRKQKAESKVSLSEYRSYKRSLRQARPEWANKSLMKEFYIESARLTDATGIKHNVDHIVPIVHPLVCGLHNEFNLQVLTRDDNIRKSNEFNIE